MGGKSGLKYFTAMAIAIPSLLIAFDLESIVSAQDRSSASTLDFKDRLASSWSNAALIHTLESATVNEIAFSPDGKILAGVESKQIALWDTNKGEIKRTIPAHYSTKYDLEIAPTAIAFSPDSSFFATATWSQGLLSPDESLTVWDIATGDKVWSLSESTGCRQVLFDRSAEVIYGACGLGITAWSFPQGDKLFSFDTQYPVDAIALSPDGKVMATADANITGGQQGEKSNQIQLWQLDGDKPALLNTLDGHTSDIARLEFTADSKKLVSSSYDGKINVWHWQSGKIERKTNNLNSSSGLFSLSEDSRLIAGNFHSSAMTSLVTGLPLRNVIAALDRQKTKILGFSPQGELFAGVKQADSDRSEIYLWQNNHQDSQSASAIADEYLPINITEYWDDRTSTKTTTVDNENQNSTKPSAIGKNPQEIALAALGLAEIIESEREEVAVDYPQDDLAVVTITQTNLLDDSVAGIRYQVKFAPYSDRSEQLWQVISAGQQFKCRRDRGHQNWSKDFCL